MPTPGVSLRITVALCALLVMPTIPGTATASPIVSRTSHETVVRIVQVAVSVTHTCVVNDAGGVMCWGSNQYGQVGDGTTTDRYTPVAVIGLTSGVSRVSVGVYHSCALLDTGGVKCWGENSDGQLGNGMGTGQSVPVDVSYLGSGVSAISAGGWHTCALSTEGAVLCWGSNSYGQLGNGTTLDAMTPITVTGLDSGATAITSGTWYSCALAGPDHVKCWGSNSDGQLGNGSTTDSLIPVDVSGIGSGVTAIAAGNYHTCVLTSSSGVKCWGENIHGELGNAMDMDSSTPVDVNGLSSGVMALYVGGYHSCVILSAGGVKCWGMNWYGQIGDGTTTDRHTPVSVNGLGDGIVMISAGGLHTCALTGTGVVKCWGENSYGQLGNGTTTNQNRPVSVSGLNSGMLAVVANGSHSCAIDNVGGVKCWGDNGGGQLGVFASTSQYLPVGVSWLSSGAIAVVAGGTYTCALTNTGGVKCWGDNTFGQLGDGTTLGHMQPMPVSGLSSGVIAISAGTLHTCALTSAGGVKCWGTNWFGGLGDGTTIDRAIPVAVSGLSSGVVAIAAGNGNTCAIVTGGGLKCWGYNYSGQLGDGTKIDRLTPVAVSGLSSGVVAIAAGGWHTCALTSSGAVKCWGLNDRGQLGDGTTTDHITPAPVSGLTSGVAAITAQQGYACALTAAGGVKCWGTNEYGQLGDGTTSNQLMPVSVSGLNSGVAVISTGPSHACALTIGGAVKCWGSNRNGQLGIDPGWTPVTVNGFGLDHRVFSPLIQQR